MKKFVIVVILCAVFLQGDAKKVCILFEQQNVPISPTISNEGSATIKEEIPSVEEDIIITLGDLLDVTDVITADAITEEVLTEKTPEIISSASDVTVSKLTNICVLEAITLFDDQNVS